MSSPAAKACAPPPHKKIKLSPCPIDKLPDSLLAKIFTHLSFKDRFLACGVSQKWAAASRIPWTDITFLDLNTIPRSMVNPIMNLCPRVRDIEAFDRTIVLEEGVDLPIREHVRTLKLRKVKFLMEACNISDDFTAKSGDLLREFFKRFPALTELVWQDIFAATLPAAGQAIAGAILPSADQQPDLKVDLRLPDSVASSLRKLALINSPRSGPPANGEVPVYLELNGMSGLECLHVENNLAVAGYAGTLSIVLANPEHLKNLRELCLYEAGALTFPKLAETVLRSLLNLEVLIYASHYDIAASGLSRLVAAVHPKLRILVVAGQDLFLTANSLLHQVQQLAQQAAAQQPPVWQPVAISLPARIPPGAGLTPPPLQIFVGGAITEYVRFTLSPQDTRTFHLIDAPMQQFLAKPGVAEMFEGVWAAGLIRAGPRFGVKDWGSPDRKNLFFSTNAALLFC